MNQVSTVGLDLAKHVFQLHGVDSTGEVVVRVLRRAARLTFLQPCRPAWSAWRPAASRSSLGVASSAELGHEVRLMPPAYVKIP